MQILGILGGGQLGRLLIEQARRFALTVHVLDPDPNAPCKGCADHFVVGSLTEYHTVYQFGKTCDLLTIEIEEVNTHALLQLAAEGLPVFPEPHLLAIIQDKALQKQYFIDHYLPTADFTLPSDTSEAALTAAIEALGGLPVVQKARRGGYDGSGVHLIDSLSATAERLQVNSFIEKKAPIAAELAVLTCRSAKSDIVVYEPVEMVFHPTTYRLDYYVAPARIPPELTAAAQELAYQTAHAFKITGLLAVEMFLLKNNELWLNEVAPRPHNSAHHTIESHYYSQYQQQIRALLGFELGAPAAHSAAAVINLLGHPNYSGSVKYQGIANALHTNGIYIHLYGKTHTRPHRKMGHLTALAPTPHQALINAQKAAAAIQIIST